MLKIDFLSWLLCHNSIVTEDRLKKKGFLGPSKCNLYLENEENATHLLIECRFAKSIWVDVFSSWGSFVCLPNSITGYFADWAHLYPGKLPNNNWFKVAWMVYPKFIF